jgi:hypothetical protein
MAKPAVGTQWQISLAQVHAALAYYYDHKQDIDAQLEADLDYARQAKATTIPHPLAYI